MIKENQKLLNYVNVISDAVMGILSIIISYLFTFYILNLDKNFPLIDYIKLSCIFIPIQLMTYACMRLYDSFRTKSFASEFGRLFFAFIFDGLFIIALLYVIKIFNFSRIALFIFLLTDLIIISAKRFAMRKMLKNLRKKGYNRKSVIIIGSGQAAQDYLRTINREKDYGYVCAGYISDTQTLSAKWLGSFDKLTAALKLKNYDEAICALNVEQSGMLGAVVEACELTGTKISVIPSIYNYMTPSSSIDMVGAIPTINIRRIPLDNMGNAFLKRTVDILGSLMLLIFTSPVVLTSMIVIKLTMGGSVIFRQRRIGLNKKEFIMYKLKSMRDNESSDTAWSTDNDPRKTRYGAFMRKFSIDELPQLVNVLKGEMSLVGPRPEIPYYVNSFKDEIPMYMIRHQVKPGITGWAQIHGYRGDTSIAKRVEYDISYIENWSFFLDISIILRTALSGFVNHEKLKVFEGSKKTKTEKNAETGEKAVGTNTQEFVKVTQK